MLEQLLIPGTWVAILSLAAMEIVLGIDNIIFLTILVSRVPAKKRDRVRRIGLGLALISRLALLGTLSWLTRLTQPLFTIMSFGISGRDLVLILGGLFLVAKSTHEIFLKLEGGPEEIPKADAPGSATRTNLILLQIMIIDVVFSLDSVITAVGMVKDLWIMATGMVIAVFAMLFFAKIIGEFVERHPSIKILALSFLILIGVLLMAEGFGQHVSKGYVYFAMAFSLSIELVNMRMRKKQVAIRLHDPYEAS